jgi:hypothetical protein
MATFNFTLPNGKPFEVKAPPGFTLEQAKAAFDKQAETGSLVGLKPGMVLSASTQAAQGLASAQALLTQTQAGVGAALTSALGAAGGALGGSLSGVAAGLTGAVGQAVSAAGAAAVVTGGAATAINTINGILANAPVVNEINFGDFAKTLPGAVAIGPLAVPDVTAVLAQARKLVDQTGSIVTDAKGLGEFGLSPAQLEAAGILKPGMAKFVADGASSVTDLLKSPAAFTGKDAVTGVQDLLNNLVKQGLIQQDLMKKGLDALKAFGIPADLLSAAGAAGSILNAAKDPLAAVALLKNLPGIGADLASELTRNIKAGGWAAAIAKKIPPEFKAETVPVPTANTVNRDTVNAAITRVLGNPKIPAPNYGPAEPPPGTAASQISRITELITAADAFVAEIEPKFRTLGANISTLLSRQTITDAEWEAVAAEQGAIVDEFNRRRLGIIGPLNEAFDNSLVEAQRATAAPRLAFNKRLQTLLASNSAAKTLITELSKKIQSPP